MQTLSDRPYAQFNFLVYFSNTGHTAAPEAGFQECSKIGSETTAADYRAGKTSEETGKKITGIHKSSEVTLKRGVISSESLQRWLEDTRSGNKSADRTVTIKLQNEDHSIVQTWRLFRARIIKHVSGPLNAKGTDVAMEELTLAYERLEIE